LRCPTNSIVLAGYDSTQQPTIVDSYSQVMSNGVYLVGEDGHAYHLTASNDVAVLTRVSNSPWTRESARERIQSNVTATVSIRTQFRDGQIAAVRQMLTTNTDTLFSNLTAQQRAYLRVQQALLRAMVRELYPEVRE
jgi:hypothetical protein